LEIYGEHNRGVIQDKMKQMKNDGHEAASSPLDQWRLCRQQLYDDADEETKALCEVEASAFNKSLASPPDPKDVYR